MSNLTATVPSSTSSGHPLAPAWAVRSFGVTHAGHVRDQNEDQYLVAELTKTLHIHHTSLPQPSVREGRQHGHLFVVADGMGGHAGGEIASRMAAQTVEEFVLNALKWFLDLKCDGGDEIVAKLQAALKEADAAIVKLAEKRPALHGMGTTLTLAFFLRGELFVAHAGDSRAAILREGHLHRLTTDHTLAAEMVRRGQLDADKVSTHKLRHVVTNVVGGPKPGVHAEIAHIQVEPNDRLLLCTDGLTDEVSDDEVAGILRDYLDPEDACRRLLTDALDRGGRDNITVVVAAFERTAA